MNAPKINNPVGIEERQPVNQAEGTPVANPSTPEEQSIAVPPVEPPVEPAVTTTEMTNETPFTSEELVPSFWNIEASGTTITATHRNGRVFQGTTKQFSSLFKV